MLNDFEKKLVYVNSSEFSLKFTNKKVFNKFIDLMSKHENQPYIDKSEKDKSFFYFVES